MISQRTSPCAVRTPATRPCSMITPVTSMPSSIFTPRLRAPLARLMHRSAGLALPSPGTHCAPCRSSVRSSGYRSPASLGVISCTSTPKPRASAAWRCSTFQRSGVRATLTLPHCFQPVARPVSASSVAYSSMPYLLMRVIVRLGRIWPISPAACQVVPLVSRPCSSSSTSLMPSLARW